MLKQDQYLKSNAAIARLMKEYEEYGSLVIAYDFDNTVFDFHGTGETYEMVIELLQDLKKINCYMVCFTASDNPLGVLKYLKDNDIPCDSLNENPPFYKSDSRKIYFNALLDDRAGLTQVYGDLKYIVSLYSKD